MTNKEIRKLALQALKSKAIDPVTFDFIDENPTRAHECQEFVVWCVKQKKAAKPTFRTATVEELEHMGYTVDQDALLGEMSVDGKQADIIATEKETYVNVVGVEEFFFDSVTAVTKLKSEMTSDQLIELGATTCPGACPANG